QATRSWKERLSLWRVRRQPVPRAGRGGHAVHGDSDCSPAHCGAAAGKSDGRKSPRRLTLLILAGTAVCPPNGLPATTTEPRRPATLLPRLRIAASRAVGLRTPRARRRRHTTTAAAPS